MGRAKNEFELVGFWSMVGGVFIAVTSLLHFHDLLLFGCGTVAFGFIFDRIGKYLRARTKTQLKRVH